MARTTGLSPRNHFPDAGWHPVSPRGPHTRYGLISSASKLGTRGHLADQINHQASQGPKVKRMGKGRLPAGRSQRAATCLADVTRRNVHMQEPRRPKAIPHSVLGETRDIHHPKQTSRRDIPQNSYEARWVTSLRHRLSSIPLRSVSQQTTLRT